MINLGLYIHIPFCVRKCYYCDFTSFSDKYCYVDFYFQHLKKELSDILNKYPDVIFNTVYIGGGTPSSVDSKYILGLFDLFSQRLSIDCEITIEANPATVTAEKLHDYLECGINRISIGVQSFENELLKSLGRIHNEEQAVNTVLMAKEAGFKNINIDLIYGIPSIKKRNAQSLKEMEETMHKALSLGVTHISTYSLIIEEGTKLYDWNTDYIDDDIDRKMYYMCQKLLENNGFKQYEISNFALNGFESKHNLKYWNCDDYMGVGLAAASCMNGVRYKNTIDFEKYINGNYLDSTETVVLNEQDQMKEFMMLGFRKLSGPDPHEFYKRFNIDYSKKFSDNLQRLIDKNLIERKNNYFILTDKGLDYANIVFREFV